MEGPSTKHLAVILKIVKDRKAMENPRHNQEEHKRTCDRTSEERALGKTVSLIQLYVYVKNRYQHMY